MKKYEDWACVCAVRSFSSAAECRNPATWAFTAFRGIISGQKRKLTGKLRPFEFTFLSPRFCSSVSAGQSLARFQRQIKLISYLGFCF